MKFKLPLTLFCLFLISCEKGDIEIFDSKPIFSSSLNGKWVLVNYWADWCPPCIIEMPYFNKLDKKPNVKVLGFHFDQFDVLEENELLLLIEKLGIDFANLKTDPRDIWGIAIPENVPTTLIIKDNEIVKTLITPQTYESLLEAVEI